MPVSEQELVERYGAVAAAGHAAMFVGAGLSTAAGYPKWDALLEDLRDEAAIPRAVTDLPLLAQYFVDAVDDGEARLRAHILDRIGTVVPVPTPGHHHIRELPISEVWTTNYDPLLELTMPDARLVVRDEDLTQRRDPFRRRVIKMHGSVTVDVTPPEWVVPPVITRRDYELYEQEHPRLWAALTATFLTRTFLFLGFSFADPNIRVLLRLARTRLDIDTPEHFAVLRRPTGADDLLLHTHQVGDLERSGVAVCEIRDFTEIEPLLRRLVRRTRAPRLFVGGSDSDGAPISELCDMVGVALADTPVSVVSLAGPAGLAVSHAMGRALKAAGRYEADRLRLYFRDKPGEPPPVGERLGTVIYTEHDQPTMRQHVLGDTRAALIVGGGETTAREVEVCAELEVPVIPLAASGGTARRTWEELSSRVQTLELGGRPVDPAVFARLDSADPTAAAAAAVQLIAQAMYLDQ